MVARSPAWNRAKDVNTGWLSTSCSASCQNSQAEIEHQHLWESFEQALEPVGFNEPCAATHHIGCTGFQHRIRSKRPMRCSTLLPTRAGRNATMPLRTGNCALRRQIHRTPGCGIPHRRNFRLHSPYRRRRGRAGIRRLSPYRTVAAVGLGTSSSRPQGACKHHYFGDSSQASNFHPEPGSGGPPAAAYRWSRSSWAFLRVAAVVALSVARLHTG